MMLIIRHEATHFAVSFNVLNVSTNRTNYQLCILFHVCCMSSYSILLKMFFSPLLIIRNVLSFSVITTCLVGKIPQIAKVMKSETVTGLILYILKSRFDLWMSRLIHFYPYKQESVCFRQPWKSVDYLYYSRSIIVSEMIF